MTRPIQLEGTLSLPSDREILMQRVFKAPAELLFDVWTKPEHVRQWYGVRSTTVTVCEIDLRVGGAWRWVVVTPAGMEVAFSGVFTVIDRPRRIERTEIYEAMPGPGCRVIIEFDEHDGQTTLSLRMVFEDQAGRDIVLKSGMELGVRECYLNIDKLVERLQLAA